MIENPLVIRDCEKIKHRSSWFESLVSVIVIIHCFYFLWIVKWVHFSWTVIWEYYFSWLVTRPPLYPPLYRLLVLMLNQLSTILLVKMLQWHHAEQLLFIVIYCITTLMYWFTYFYWKEHTSVLTRSSLTDFAWGSQFVGEFLWSFVFSL